MKAYKIFGIVVVVAVLAIGSGIAINKLVRSTVMSRHNGQRYVVSLGDSVAAGAGLNGQNGRSTSNTCDVSAASYPYIIVSQLHLQIEQFACSGATITQASTGSSNNVLDRQLPAAKPFIPNSDVVITAGANDIGWLQALTSCVSSACPSADDPQLIAKIQTMQMNLTDLIKQMYTSHPHRVVVNAYYQLLNQNTDCVASFGVTPAKAAAINALEDAMNTAIAKAAQDSGATLVRPNFSGHLLCDTDTWIQGVQAGAPLHPTAAGQQQIAHQDVAALR